MGKQSRKIRQVISRQVKVQASDVAHSLQDMIIGCSLWVRFKYAWRIVWGKKFLG